MNAVLFHGPGRPLEWIAADAPEPRGAEVLVRVRCCTLCRSDLHTHAGRRTEPTPCVLGHEIAGSIVAFGPEAPRRDWQGEPLEAGTRVSWAVAVGCGACFYCRHDLPQKCERPYKYGHRRAELDRFHGGGLCEFVLLQPGTAIFRVPDTVPDDVAALANCAVATVAGLLRLGGVAAGQHVAVLGAGVLGVAACAMAAAAGAIVIACDPVAECRERAMRFGAAQACGPDEFLEAVQKATDRRGADLVLELAGAAESVRSAIALARIGGTVMLGGSVAPAGSEEIDPEQIVRRMITLRGVHNYHPHDLGSALAFLAGPGQRFPWSELIGAEFPLAAVEAAFAAAHARPGQRVAVRPE